MAGGTCAHQDGLSALKAEFRRILREQTPEDLLAKMDAQELQEIMAQAHVEARARARRKKSQLESQALPRAGGVFYPPARSRAGCAQPGGVQPKGLANLGNTCYLGSVLQCLSQTHPFNEDLEKYQTEPGSIGSALSQVLCDLRSTDPSGSASVETILGKLSARFTWYEGKSQQDAHELLRTLLGAVADERTKAGQTSQQHAVQNSFQGHICEAVLCWRCKKVSFRRELFLDLSVDMPAGQGIGPLGLPGWITEPLLPQAESTEQVEDDAKQEETEENCVSADVAASAIDVQLERLPGRRVALGLEWADCLHHGCKALKKVSPGSLAETWNKRQPMERNLVPGLLLFSVNGKEDHDEMMQALKDERRLQLRFVPEAVMEARQDRTEPDSKTNNGFTVELVRESNSKVSWGFRLDQEYLKEGELVVASVEPDSLLDAWNLRCLSTGRRSDAVCPGDRVLAVNGTHDIEDMRAALQHPSRRKNVVLCEHAERRLTSAVEESAGAALDEDACFEVELQHLRDDGTDSWGIEWGQVDAMGEMYVKSVFAGSAAAMWNIRCLSRGDEHLCIERGDCLADAARESSSTIVLRRSKERQAAVRAMSGALAAQKLNVPPQLEETRQEILRMAEECIETLQAPLKDLFQTQSCSSADTLSLQDCLQHLGVVEALEDNFRPIYHCSNCNCLGNGRRQEASFASKKSWLQHPLPPILPVQLKRFRGEQGNYFKSRTRVQTCSVIDLRALLLSEDVQKKLQPHVHNSADMHLPQDEADLRYELYAVCAHLGASMERGHYVAFVNMGPSLQEEAWHLLDDSRVSPCSREDALQVEAYIAFYRRL